jgi:GntR family transcriptional regulator / MocR family aminotransferase
LSPFRRAALVAWARRVGGLIVEDDYDGEFWFDSTDWPPSLQSMAPDCVVYGSSVSKTLAPGLRLGWVVVPGQLMAAAEAARMTHDLGMDAISQLAYCLFIETGRLDRHLMQMNKRYRQHRAALVSTLCAEFPGVAVVGRAAGLHCMVRLPHGMDERQVVDVVARHGVVVRGAGHFHYEAPPPAAGLVMGYAHHHPDSLVRAARTMAATMRAVRPPSRDKPTPASRPRGADETQRID